MQFQMTMKIHVTNWRETQENHQAMSHIEYNKGCVSARQQILERETPIENHFQHRLPEFPGYESGRNEEGQSENLGWLIFWFFS